MVRVTLYEDGEYKVEDVDPHCATQRLYGMEKGRSTDIYYCKKERWKEYLLKLCDTKDIDKKIKELVHYKRQKEVLKQKILSELREAKEQSERK